MSSNSKKCIIMERRPIRTLKEFLRDDELSNSNSSSGLGFGPRGAQGPPRHHRPPPAGLPRSRSRSVSSFQKLLRSLHITTPSSHSPHSLSSLPRSLSKSISRKFTRRPPKVKSSSKYGDCHHHHHPPPPGEGTAKIRVRDILRWRSFRDVAGEITVGVAGEEESPPSDSAGPSSSGGSSATTTTSKGSSWGEEDSDFFSFTAGELPCWWDKGGESGECDPLGGDEYDDGNDDDDEGKKRGHYEEDALDGGQTTDAPLVGPKEENAASDVQEEKEQHSPVSVLNSPFRDEISDEEFSSSFDQSLANVERTKARLLQSIQWLESLAGVEDELSTLDEEGEETYETEDEEEDEQETKSKIEIEAKRRAYLMKVLGRLRRGEQGLKNKEECVRDMDAARARWGELREEREEVGLELEDCVLHDLVDEALVDLFGW